MTGFTIERRATLPDDFDIILADARQEGIAFVEGLRPDCEQLGGYGRPGEGLWVARDGHDLAAVAVLSRDPYRTDGVTGRLRFIYVRPAYRRRGLLNRLTALCLAEAPGRWASLRLRAESPIAARTYQKFGFVPVDDPTASHERVTPP